MRRIIATAILATALQAAEEVVLQKLTLDDGRVLIGRYDAAASTLGVVDEKTLRVVMSVQIDKAKITAQEEVKVAKPEANPLDKRGLNGKWITSYEAALKLAAESRRPILAVCTGSDWCPWCIKLEKEVFSTDAFKTWAAGKVVLLYLDFPRQTKLPKELAEQNDMLATKWGCNGFPSVFLLSSKGVKYDWKHGYSEGGAEKWVAYVESWRAQLTRK